MARRSRSGSSLPWMVGIGVGLTALVATGAALAVTAAPGPRRPESGPPPPRPPAAGPPPPPPPPAQRQQGVDPDTLRRIDQYSALIDQIAQAEKVDPAVIRGLIAAETRGNPSSVSSAGYRGLMQASRDAADADPATSIRKGAKKIGDFGASLARQFGAQYTALGRWDQVRWLARGYNAGPGTVAKAVAYGGARWTEAEPYQRALLHTGAYATRPYAPDHAAAERWRKKLAGRDLTLAQARAEGMPEYLATAIQKKWEHTAPYVERVVAYARHYARGQEGRA